MSYELMPRSSASLTPTQQTSSRQVDKACKGLMQAGAVRMFQDNVEAAVVSNHMQNTAGLYYEGVALAGNDPGLAEVLGVAVRRYAVKQP